MKNKGNRATAPAFGERHASRNWAPQQTHVRPCWIETTGDAPKTKQMRQNGYENRRKKKNPNNKSEISKHTRTLESIKEDSKKIKKRRRKKEQRSSSQQKPSEEVIHIERARKEKEKNEKLQELITAMSKGIDLTGFDFKQTLYQISDSLKKEKLLPKATENMIEEIMSDA